MPETAACPEHTFTGYMSTDSKSWYALHVKANSEKAVAATLEGKNLEVYLPAYLRRRRWSDRIKEIECPLFPGYVFCRFDVNSRLPILTTSGVRSIVGNGRAPSPVDPEEMTAIQSITRSGLAAMPWPFLHVGERVLVRRGPLAGIEGTLLAMPNRYRIAVSMTLLQRSVAVEIDADMVCATRQRFVRQPLPALAI